MKSGLLTQSLEMYLHFYTNFLVNLIIDSYFKNHRCLLILSEQDFDYGGSVPFVSIKVKNGSFNHDFIFNNYGCQGVVIISNNSIVFSYFEKQIRMNLERFNMRRFLVVTEMNGNFERKFYNLEELKYVTDVLVVSSYQKFYENNFPIKNQDLIFDLKTHSWIKTKIVFLDRWFSKNQSFLFNTNLYPDKLSNQMGHPLRMATFTYEPYSIIASSSTEDFYGSELKLGVEFSSKYNMTPIPVINDKDYWGEIYSNWSGNGLLGNLVEDKADIGFGALYTWEICYHYLDLSKPSVRTGIALLVPAPKPAARWLTPLFSYSLDLWICVLVIFTASIITFSYILYFYNHSFKKRLKLIKRSYKYFFTIAARLVLKPVLLQPIIRSEFPIDIASRLMLASVLILSLFFTSTYSSGLATVMTLPRYDDAIDTVEDFAWSDLQWGATQDAWITSIQNAKEPIYVRIVSKFNSLSEEKLEELSKTGAFAFSIERLPFENFAVGDYLKKEVIINFHLMKEDLYWEQCVLMLRKNSVLLPLLDQFILTVFEAGLISKWQNEAVDLFMDPDVQTMVKYFIHHSIEREVVKLKWSHVEGAFAILISGYLLSFIVFIFEVVLKTPRLQK